MRLKTKLVLAITALVFFISGLLSLVYVSQLLHAAVQQSYDTNRMVANQIRFALQKALENGLRDRKVDPNNPAQLLNLEAMAVRQDEPLQSLIDSVNRYSLSVYDISIGDSRSRTLLSTDPENEDKPLPARRDYSRLIHANSVRLLSEVFGPPTVYDVSLPLERNGAPFASVHVGVRTTLLRAVYAPWLTAAITLMGFALITALAAAFLLSNLALRPLEEIGKQLDVLSTTEVETDSPAEDTALRVSHKIERIGRRMKNVEEVYSALQENLNRILGNLQDGILLFTSDGRAVLVSEAARRFLTAGNETLLGLNAREIFASSTALGRALCEALDAGLPLVQQEVRTGNGRRVQVSLDFIHDSHSNKGLGALVTLHDPESVEEIESDLELSRRMAAIGRLTAGVGHEVKNPINSIVVHLELLRNKLADDSAPAARHLEIIHSEIHRLDRVVQVLADFSRPVELQLRELDLCELVNGVLTLASTEFSSHKVTLVGSLPSPPLMARVDAGLLKQAVLNVVLNGAQAMPEGGKLDVRLEADGRNAILRIADQGPGIPDEIREKIFNLYFTTKATGSGIGLAMTYRILQLHHGSIEVESNAGRGTEFLLRIPLAGADWGRHRLHPASSAAGKGPDGCD